MRHIHGQNLESTLAKRDIPLPEGKGSAGRQERVKWGKEKKKKEKFTASV